MCETKTVITAEVSLLIAGFCIYQVNSQKKVGHNSHLKCESLCEKEYSGYCLNSGECYYLIGEGIAGCICTWLNGGKRCEKCM